jgi:pseudaminic acid cytidylyltransferase
MNNLAIIPARGGSKRIPRKNIKLFLGKPIIAYSIEAALNSCLFEEVMVSTDDEEIAEISIKYGAKVPFLRSPNNSNDTATTFDVLAEVVFRYKNQGRRFDNLCCIYPCAPFCNNQSLAETYRLLIEKKFDTVFPVVQYSTPIQRALEVENDKITMVNPEFQNSRSQDLRRVYYDAGQFYWIQVSRTFEHKKIYSDFSGCIILDELSAHDIDTEIDWKIAELKYKLSLEA